MARYIDADALGKNIIEKYSGRSNGKAIATMALDIINNAPTADAIEVVLCKDCKYFAPTVDWYECEFHEQLTMPDNYCSFGERGTNDY